MTPVHSARQYAEPSLFDLPAPTPKPNPVAQERQRLNAAARRVLAFLQRHGEATNVELCDPSVGGMRAVGGRLYELRKDGWQIETKRVVNGLFRYRLVGRKDQVLSKASS